MPQLKLTAGIGMYVVLASFKLCGLCPVWKTSILVGSVPVAPLKRDGRSLEEVERRYPEAHPPPDFSDHGNIFRTRYQLFA